MVDLRFHICCLRTTLSFCIANREEPDPILDILSKFEIASGQSINLDKMGMFFSPNTQPRIRSDIITRFGVSAATNMEKYLGLPAIVGRGQRKAFSYLMQKTERAITSWNTILLSKGGKEVLLKAVAQAIPTYTMYVFLITPTLCDRMENKMNRYWWSHNRLGSGIFWSKWMNFVRRRKMVEWLSESSMISTKQC